MKRKILYLTIIIFALFLTACGNKGFEAENEEATTVTRFDITSWDAKDMPKGEIFWPLEGYEIVTRGTAHGWAQIQYQAYNFAGYWGDPISVTLNGNMGIKDIQVFYKVSHNSTPIRFYPQITAVTITSVKKGNEVEKTSTYYQLDNIVAQSTPITDSTGYTAQMYTDVTTVFRLYYSQGGIRIDTMPNPDSLIVVKLEYSGLTDPSLSWPDSVDITDYDELGQVVTPGEALYVISTYNGLSGEQKLPMIYNVVTGKWEFLFKYPENAGMNFRVEKENGQALYMGYRLTTSLGTVSCCNVHYFPDATGHNTWMLFEASLNDGVPTIPWPNINQLINVLEIIINPGLKKIPYIPNPELTIKQLQKI